MKLEKIGRLKDREVRHGGKGGRLKSMNIADKEYDLVLILTSNLLNYTSKRV